MLKIMLYLKIYIYIYILFLSVELVVGWLQFQALSPSISSGICYSLSNARTRFRWDRGWWKPSSLTQPYNKEDENLEVVYWFNCKYGSNWAFVYFCRPNQVDNPRLKECTNISKKTSNWSKHKQLLEEAQAQAQVQAQQLEDQGPHLGLW